MSRWIDADALIARAIQDSERLYLESVVKHTPSIKTKQIKYYDEDESVWKIGEVIVDGQMD